MRRKYHYCEPVWVEDGYSMYPAVVVVPGRYPIVKIVSGHNKGRIKHTDRTYPKVFPRVGECCD